MPRYDLPVTDGILYIVSNTTSDRVLRQMQRFDRRKSRTFCVGNKLTLELQIVRFALESQTPVFFTTDASKNKKPR